MSLKVYLETTIASYLAAHPSRDLIVAAHQRVTHDWWSKRRRFDVFVSKAVFVEAETGDPEAVSRRLRVLEGISVLEAGQEVAALAKALLSAGAIPEKAAVDAVHVAVAAVNGMDFLLTWNCAHIANAAVRRRIEQVCLAAGYRPPIICTPEELLEEER
ncbi:MAG: type II toxin-antitoxin system VapC family toxin [Planctomycetes bacterium]|nr:type II toxin-antitoxin system VapC family toxin [Planctomycetota bacterium]